MPRKVRVGMVGTSMIADFMHLPSLKGHAQAELVAVCGRDEKRLEELASKYAIPRRFRDYHEMIERGDLQALVIAVPDDLHYGVTTEALNAGLHVLCEKPLAMNAAQAKEMLSRAESKGVVHMTFFTYRWLPAYRYAVRLIGEGYVGRCLQFEARYLAGDARGNRYGWTFDRQRSNGVLANLGSHMIDLARLCVGEITRVFGHPTPSSTNWTPRRIQSGAPTTRRRVSSRSTTVRRESSS